MSEAADAPWAEFVTEARIVEFHDRAIRETHGKHGPPRDGCVDGSLGAAWSAERYTQRDTIDATAQAGLLFSCYVVFYLINNHCFADGNKRAALMACQCALGRLGLTIDATPAELHGFLTRLADNPKRTRDEVVSWIAPRLVELE